MAKTPCLVFLAEGTGGSKVIAVQGSRSYPEDKEKYARRNTTLINLLIQLLTDSFGKQRFIFAELLL